MLKRTILRQIISHEGTCTEPSMVRDCDYIVTGKNRLLPGKFPTGGYHLAQILKLKKKGKLTQM